MRSILVKEIMVPIAAYATVPEDANLYEAVLALESAQEAVEPLKHKHRAILVLDECRKVVGKITMLQILMALEPKYAQLEAEGVPSRSGYSPEFINSMLRDYALWSEPLEFICNRAAQLKVVDFMEVPTDGSFIDENATLGDAIHHLVLQKHHSLIVTGGEDVVGILRLSDIFVHICDRIKACEF